MIWDGWHLNDVWISLPTNSKGNESGGEDGIFSSLDGSVTSNNWFGDVFLVNVIMLC